MTDDVTAQRILQDWATSRGFSSTMTVDGPEKKLYFHYGGVNGFAFINFDKSPSIKMIVSTDRHLGAYGAVLQSIVEDNWVIDPPALFEPSRPKKQYDEYNFTLADEKVFIKIERILDRAIDSYGG